MFCKIKDMQTLHILNPSMNGFRVLRNEYENDIFLVERMYDTWVDIHTRGNLLKDLRKIKHEWGGYSISIVQLDKVEVEFITFIDIWKEKRAKNEQSK